MALYSLALVIVVKNSIKPIAKDTFYTQCADDITKSCHEVSSDVTYKFVKQNKVFKTYIKTETVTQTRVK